MNYETYNFVVSCLVILSIIYPILKTKRGKLKKTVITIIDLSIIITFWDTVYYCSDYLYIGVFLSNYITMNKPVGSYFDADLSEIMNSIFLHDRSIADIQSPGPATAPYGSIYDDDNGDLCATHLHGPNNTIHNNPGLQDYKNYDLLNSERKLEFTSLKHFYNNTKTTMWYHNPNTNTNTMLSKIKPFSAYDLD